MSIPIKKLVTYILVLLGTLSLYACFGSGGSSSNNGGQAIGGGTNSTQLLAGVPAQDPALGGGATSPGIGVNGGTISELTAYQMPDGAIYYTGTHQGTQVNMAHTGAAGQGVWYVYAGTPGNRIRATITDTGGLQEILNMDQGYRTTITYIGAERIEYRFYASDNTFAYGAVLYNVAGVWNLGLMFSDSFRGYASLVSVTDVTAKITNPNTTLVNLDLFSTLGFFITSAEAASLLQENFGSVSWVTDNMKIFSLTGLVAVTGVAEATLAAAGAGSAIAATIAAVPVAAPIAIGVGIGLLASRHIPTLAIGTLSQNITDLYNRITSPTSYSLFRRRVAPPACDSTIGMILDTTGCYSCNNWWCNPYIWTYSNLPYVTYP